MLPLGNHGFPRVLCLRLGSPENPSLTGVVGPGASAAESCVSGSMWLFNMAATAWPGLLQGSWFRALKKVGRQRN